MQEKEQQQQVAQSPPKTHKRVQPKASERRWLGLRGNGLINAISAFRFHC